MRISDWSSDVCSSDLDPVRDFAPVSLLASVPIMLAANPKAPYTSVAELIAYAKQHPGSIAYGSQGSGTTSHLTMELLKLEAGIDLQHIPYRGSAPAATDLIDRKSTRLNSSH